jgi:hypothetical protein
LEDRELLSATVQGTDPKGDHWTLQLFGPGTMNVSYVTPTGPQALTPGMKNTPVLIDTITISGTNGLASRLVGTVTPAPGSDGKVFFQNLLETGGVAQQHLDATDPIGQLQPPEVENGILAIKMPNFWLGNTRGTVPPADSRSSALLNPGQVPNFAEVGKINIPDGVSTLNFGGVDTKFTPTGGTPLAGNGQNNRFNVNLGVPFAIGTSIIVNKVVTDATAASSTTSAPANQDTVFFNVAGRMNLFQANEIDGDPKNPGTQFLNQTPTSTSSLLAGGTYVVDQDFDSIITQNIFNANQQFVLSQGLGLTGQGGFIRVGGNATEFTVMVDNNPSTSSGGASTNASIANFSIGGQTNDVLVLAGGTVRNAFFGLGMDNTKINADVIGGIQANRGVTDSQVTVARGIGRFVSGGDVVGSNVQSGYAMQFELDGADLLNGVPTPSIINRELNSNNLLGPLAGNGGQINARIAGDVVNSVFSASVEPVPNYFLANTPGVLTQPSTINFPFGAPGNVIYPRGVINAKVEGTINNSGIVSSNNQTVPGQISVGSGQAGNAFFAKVVKVQTGPVIPPVVPEPPYSGTVYGRYQRLVGVFARHKK